MDHLRKLFEGLDFANVETFIASGNVIFESSEKSTTILEERIASHLHESLGYKVATFVRTVSEIAETASYKPFPDEDLSKEGGAVYIGFLGSAPSAEARSKLMALRNPVDEFHVHGREMYWLCRTRMSESAISGALVEKTLGVQTTLRNSTTVRKLAAKYNVGE